MLLCDTIPGLDNLFAVSQVFEILTHGFCLLSLKLNGYLITAAATFHTHSSNRLSKSSSSSFVQCDTACLDLSPELLSSPPLDSFTWGLLAISGFLRAGEDSLTARIVCDFCQRSCVIFNQFEPGPSQCCQSTSYLWFLSLEWSESCWLWWCCKLARQWTGVHRHISSERQSCGVWAVRTRTNSVHGFDLWHHGCHGSPMQRGNETYVFMFLTVW